MKNLPSYWLSKYLKHDSYKHMGDQDKWSLYIVYTI